MCDTCMWRRDPSRQSRGCWSVCWMSTADCVAGLLWPHCLSRWAHGCTGCLSVSHIDCSKLCWQALRVSMRRYTVVLASVCAVDLALVGIYRAYLSAAHPCRILPRIDVFSKIAISEHCCQRPLKGWLVTLTHPNKPLFLFLENRHLAGLSSPPPPKAWHLLHRLMSSCPLV